MTQGTIFFSYSRKDSEFVKQLATTLREGGATIWLDQLDIKPSMHWDNAIEQALADCSTVLVFLSSSSVQSENVKDEYAYAIEQGKKVIPVLIEPCEIPFRLARLQYADFTQDAQAGMDTLTQALQLKKGATAKFRTAGIQPKKKQETATEQVVKEKSRKPVFFGLGAVIIVAVLLIVFWGDLFSAAGTSTVTVFVHEASGKDQLVLPNRGQVTLVFGDAKVEETINSKGEATFKQIPSSFFNDQAAVEILFSDPEGEPYKAVYADSSYVLKKGTAIALPVKLFGLGSVSGLVKDFNTGKPVAGVRIAIAGAEAYSNDFGEYELEIPPNKQQKFQTVRAFKAGYKLFELANVPVQTNQELAIALKPETP